LAVLFICIIYSGKELYSGDEIHFSSPVFLPCRENSKNGGHMFGLFFIKKIFVCIKIPKENEG